MVNAVTVTEQTEPESLLELPKGRLMIGEIVGDFSPENVIDAARNIIESCRHEYNEHTFYSQAGVIAHAANSGSWNSRAEYKPI